MQIIHQAFFSLVCGLKLHFLAYLSIFWMFTEQFFFLLFWQSLDCLYVNHFGLFDIDPFRGLERAPHSEPYFYLFWPPCQNGQFFLGPKWLVRVSPHKVLHVLCSTHISGGHFWPSEVRFRGILTLSGDFFYIYKIFRNDFIKILLWTNLDLLESISIYNFVNENKNNYHRQFFSLDACSSSMWIPTTDADLKPP